MLKEQLPPTTEEVRPQSGNNKRGDRILAWCFLASILINLGFGLWLNYADIYGEKRQADVNKVMHIRTYKPPVKQKPKPKPKIIPPKIIPKIVHVLPRPTPPRPAPPHAAPPTHFTVGHHSTSKTAIAVEAPPPPVAEAPAQPVAPENTTVQAAPPAPPAPVYAPKPTPPAPVVKYVPPAPPAPVYHPPPPPPHRAGYSDVPYSNAAVIGDFPAVELPQDADASSIKACTIAWEVGPDGHASGVKITGRSGNGDFDRSCQEAIQSMRFRPAIQDHYPQAQRMEHVFAPGA